MLAEAGACGTGAPARSFQPPMDAEPASRVEPPGRLDSPRRHPRPRLRFSAPTKGSKTAAEPASRGKGYGTAGVLQATPRRRIAQHHGLTRLLFTLGRTASRQGAENMRLFLRAYNLYSLRDALYCVV